MYILEALDLHLHVLVITVLGISCILYIGILTPGNYLDHSFQSQGFWKPKVGSDANIDEMAYNSTSRLETKRSHQWFMDGPETDLPSNKKQAVELTSNHSFLELLNSNPSQWGVASGFQTSSGHFCEQLFDLESSRMTNYDERGVPLIGTGKMDVGRKVHEDLLNDSSFALSMSHMPEDPGLGLHYGGARKVKVSQVKGPEHVMPVSMENGYNKMEDHHLFMPHTFVKSDENPISLALPSGIGVGDDRIITLGKTNGGDSSGISIGKLHGIEDKSASIGQTYGEDQNNMSISLMMGTEQHSIMSSGQGYQSDSCTMSTCHLYNQEGNSSSVSVGNSYNKTENFMSHTIGKGQSTIISFGGCDDDTNSSGRLNYNYEMLMGQTSLQMLNAVGNMGLVKSNDGGQIIIPGVGDNSKKKEEHNMIKKSPSNNFPSNVRSLLSTGILDGVHVKYIAWSREVISVFICLIIKLQLLYGDNANSLCVRRSSVAL